MKTLLLIFAMCFLVMITYILCWLIFEWGKRELERENEYDNLYAEIKGNVYSWPVTPVYRYRLLSKLNELAKLKYKNPEKTKVLRDNFFWKYRAIAKELNYRNLASTVLQKIENGRVILSDVKDKQSIT